MGNPRGTGKLWNDILGGCQNSLDSFIEQHLLESGEHTERNSPSGTLNKEAAVLLADQKQAFERLSIRWFKRVLDGWQFPIWVRRSFMALVESRSVTAAGQIGVLRRLLRSIGMGGAASPSSWGIAYDPIVEGMFRAIGVEAPTYVDDLAGLINGPAQAMRASYYLIWASWAAGLEVSTHTCCRPTYASDSHELRTACARLPVKTWLSDDGCRHVAGIPPTIMRTLIGEIWPTGGHLAVETHTRCTCSLKAALVPNRKHARWRTIMMGIPFRVVNTWPYLGAALTSTVDDSCVGTHSEEQETADGSTSDLTGGNDGAETNPRNTLVSMGAIVLTHGRANPPSANNNAQWTEAMKALLAYQVWTRSVGRMETRADLIAVANSSVGRRCLLWNAYSDSLIPYLARVVMPDDSTAKRMPTARRDAIRLGTPWCPLKALSALGIIHGVKGSPRCPKIFVQAHGAWAYIRGAPWRPAHARGEQGNLWRCAVLHANPIVAHGSAPEVLINESISRAARVIVQTADARFIDPQAEPAHGTGSSLYAIIWHFRYAAEH